MSSRVLGRATSITCSSSTYFLKVFRVSDERGSVELGDNPLFLALKQCAQAYNDAPCFILLMELNFPESVAWAVAVYDKFARVTAVR